MGSKKKASNKKASKKNDINVEMQVPDTDGLEDREFRRARSKIAKNKQALVRKGKIPFPHYLENVDEQTALVEVNLPVRLKINQVNYNRGKHIVPKHLADTMVSMASLKQKADLEVVTGRNFRISRDGATKKIVEVPAEA